MLRINDVLSTVESVVDACCNDKIEVLLVPAGGFTKIFSKTEIAFEFFDILFDTCNPKCKYFVYLLVKYFEYSPAKELNWPGSCNGSNCGW